MANQSSWPVLLSKFVITHKGDAENPTHNTLSKTTSAIFLTGDQQESP